VPEEAARDETFPPMPLEAWTPSKETLHRFLQIVGKIRLSTAPRRNHWWHIPYHLTGRGITTRPMGSDPIFTIDFDFVDHRLLVSTGDGRMEWFPLAGNSVASFYEQTLTLLGVLGIGIIIERPGPFDLADSTPFADDVEHRDYDPFWINRYWRILSEVNLILEEFAGHFSGKTSPVHHFWHSMDIAVTRFSDREVDHPPSVDSVNREAYSREVISFGFWFGDPSFPEPAFYSYTAPEPDGLSLEPLFPSTAEWLDRGTGHLAVYRYNDARATTDPRSSVLEFLESAYRAGATRAGWDIARLASPDGSTSTRSSQMGDGRVR
jgi:hypothetical protein